MKIKQKSELMFGRFITGPYPAWRLGKPLRIEATARPVTSHTFDFFHARLARMSALNVLTNRLKLGLVIAMLTAVTGCIGVVGDGGYYGDGAYVGGWWGGWWGGGGGYYDRGRDVHGYSARGAASRGAAHGGGGHGGGGGGHGGGGHGGGGGGHGGH
jgi:hypothetical protein